MIKAVFFDWFNTLAHYHPPREELERQALQELGFAVSPQVVSRGLYLADKNFYEENARLPIRQRSPEEQARIYAGFQLTILQEASITPKQDLVLKLMSRMRELNATMKFILYDDVLPTLKAVKGRKLTVGLLTNLQREIDSMCRELGIASYIDFTVTSGEVGADKPQAPIFLKALELAKIKPQEAIHVGDQYNNDVKGARAVGIVPLLLDRTNLYPEITDCPRIQSLIEVTKYLG
ncbi:MAG: HAD family hydrolase [Dehalococcoidales bacterium]|nr:HAD family hydrolase [Dehalococcoidales bacterium]